MSSEIDPLKEFAIETKTCFDILKEVDAPDKYFAGHSKPNVRDYILELRAQRDSLAARVERLVAVLHSANRSVCTAHGFPAWVQEQINAALTAPHPEAAPSKASLERLIAEAFMAGHVTEQITNGTDLMVTAEKYAKQFFNPEAECKECGQVFNESVTGEYPCEKCGMPKTHDEVKK